MREQAISQDYERSKRGLIQGFYYVDLKKLERAGITPWKPEPGDCFVRILPPPESEVLFCRRVFVHYNVGPDRQTVLCPRRTHTDKNVPMDKPCPICDLAMSLYQKDKNSAEAKALFPSERYLYFVIDVANEKTEALGIRWWDAPKKIQENIRQLSVDKRTGKAIDISDPKTGRELMFVRKGSDISTQYEGFQLGESKEIPKEWYEDLPTFSDVLLVRSVEEIQLLISVKESSDVPEEVAETEENVEKEVEETKENVENSVEVIEERPSKKVPTPQKEVAEESKTKTEKASLDRRAQILAALNKVRAGKQNNG